jgi:hypothetical protein
MAVAPVGASNRAAFSKMLVVGPPTLIPVGGEVVYKFGV